MLKENTQKWLLRWQPTVKSRRQNAGACTPTDHISSTHYDNMQNSQTINYLRVRLQHALDQQQAGLGPRALPRCRVARQHQNATVVCLSSELFWGGHPLTEFWLALSVHIHLDTEERQTFSAGPFLFFHFYSHCLLLLILKLYCILRQKRLLTGKIETICT
jgi:hypothetical protein